MTGQALGHYRIFDRLGAGGMGEVYLAEDSKLKRRVALKILPPDMASHPARRSYRRRVAALRPCYLCTCLFDRLRTCDVVSSRLPGVSGSMTAPPRRMKLMSLPAAWALPWQPMQPPIR